MIDWLFIVVLIFLGIASFLDIKYKQLPSIMLSVLIFVVLVLKPENLLFGVLGFAFALVIKDLLSFNGMDFGTADMKILIVIGLLISSIKMFILFVILFAVFQFVYTILWRLKVSKEKEMPFIPCLFFTYMAMFFAGGFL